ncbi:MAG: hypothetical protein MR355_05370 [Lachnospiraceae bacterium]|nr:hypothetical protein [Lachnospiraceae bacterium]
MNPTSGKKTNFTLWSLVAILAILLLFLAISSAQPSNRTDDSTQELLPAYDYTLKENEKDIDDVVLFSDSGVTITALAMGWDENNYPYLTVAIDNQSESDINPLVTYCAVNGVALQATIEGTVAYGETVFRPLVFSDPFFSYAKQTEIGKLQIELSFVDAETNSVLSTDTTIHEVIFDETIPLFDVKKLDNVIVLDNKDAYRIYYVGSTDLTEDDIVEFVFYIEDASETPIYFESGDLMVDGIMQADYAFGAVVPGNGVFVSVACDDDSYLENDIQEAVITFSFFDENYNNLYESGELHFQP